MINATDMSLRRSRGRTSCDATTANSAMTIGLSYECRAWNGKPGERLKQISPLQSAHVATNESNAAIRLLWMPGDRTASNSIASSLSDHGFAVKTAEDADALLDASGDVEADVALLEWNPPDMKSIEVLSELRTRGARIPVVLLSREGRSAEESLALDWGATDFVLQSRGLEVLIRRLKHVAGARRHRVDAAQGDVVVGKLCLDQKTNRALWQGKDIDLTLGEYNIVHLLASTPGRHVTYRAVYDRLRGQGFIAGYGDRGYWANVRSAIRRIRKKFRACDPSFDDIKNYAGFGYCWVKPS